MVDGTILYTPVTSLAGGERAWKPTPLSVTGVAEEGRGPWRKLLLQHNLEGKGVGRLPLQVVGGEAFTGIFLTYYCHLLFQNCHFS